METSIKRPAHLAPEEIALAALEGVQRALQAREISHADAEQVSGGASYSFVAKPWIIAGGRIDPWILNGGAGGLAGNPAGLGKLAAPTLG